MYRNGRRHIRVCKKFWFSVPTFFDSLSLSESNCNQAINIIVANFGNRSECFRRSPRRRSRSALGITARNRTFVHTSAVSSNRHGWGWRRILWLCWGHLEKWKGCREGRKIQSHTKLAPKTAGIPALWQSSYSTTRGQGSKLIHQGGNWTGASESWHQWASNDTIHSVNDWNTGLPCAHWEPEKLKQIRSITLQLYSQNLRPTTILQVFQKCLARATPNTTILDTR